MGERESLPLRQYPCVPGSLAERLSGALGCSPVRPVAKRVVKRATGLPMAGTGLCRPFVQKDLTSLHTVAYSQGDAGFPVEDRHHVKPTPLFNTHDTHSENAIQRRSGLRVANREKN